jgi:hypothetical protein
MKNHSRGSNRRRGAASEAGRAAAPTTTDHDRIYDRARRLMDERRYEEARRLYASLDADHVTPSLRAEAVNSLAVLYVIESPFALDDVAGFERALAIDPNCECARLNLEMLQSCPCCAEAGVIDEASQAVMTSERNHQSGD